MSIIKIITAIYSSFYSIMSIVTLILISTHTAKDFYARLLKKDSTEFIENYSFKKALFHFTTQLIILVQLNNTVITTIFSTMFVYVTLTGLAVVRKSNIYKRAASCKKGLFSEGSLIAIGYTLASLNLFNFIH